MFNKKTSLSITYYGMGEHEIDGEAEYSWQDESDKFEFERPINMFTLTLGIHF